ncbi:hypothetical protein INR49_010258 [Caranx melampygus]|nr:hypothetical protein INR49_010258 [Caranx melampygus]
MFKPSLLVTVGKKKSRRIQEEHEERLGSREVRRSDRGRWRNSLNCLCFSDGVTGPSCESIFTERRPGLNTCERHPRSPLELTRVLGPRMMRVLWGHWVQTRLCSPSRILRMFSAPVTRMTGLPRRFDHLQKRVERQH